MKARALPARRNRRSTRGQGRHVRRPHRPNSRIVDSSLSDPPLKNYEARHQPSECGVGVDHGAKLAQSPVCAPDESLYRLGDGSDLPTIDVRADLTEVAS
jgi:hypothetical protein